jgi:hypothetical protein
MSTENQADYFFAERLTDAMHRRAELVIRMVDGREVIGKVLSVNAGLFHMSDMSVHRISHVSGIESELMSRN